MQRDDEMKRTSTSGDAVSAESANDTTVKRASACALRRRRGEDAARRAALGEGSDRAIARRSASVERTGRGLGMELHAGDR